MQEASVHASALSQEKGDHIPWGLSDDRWEQLS